jgi:parallel beta helix pectate lyase-like protein
MRRFASSILIQLFLTVVITSVATAQQRTFVSATGSDVNPCTRISPCRNFAAALTAVIANGEIVVLDSAGYGPVTINKSVSVISPLGVYAGITAAPGGNGITVNAPGGLVEVRGITIRGLGTGSDGIKLDAAQALHVEHCVISGFTGRGVNTMTASGSNLYINDCSFRDEDSAVLALASSGILKVAIDNSRAENTGNAAFYASDNSRVTVKNSVAAGSGVAGFRVLIFNANSPAEMNVESSMSSNNSCGLLVDAGTPGLSLLRASNMIITNNDTGICASVAGGPGSAISFGNNSVAGNTTPGAFSLTISQQ